MGCEKILIPWMHVPKWTLKTVAAWARRSGYTHTMLGKLLRVYYDERWWEYMTHPEFESMLLRKLVIDIEPLPDELRGKPVFSCDCCGRWRHTDCMHVYSIGQDQHKALSYSVCAQCVAGRAIHHCRELGLASYIAKLQ